MKVEQKGEIKSFDQQLTKWRMQFNKEIPERVGLAFNTNDEGEVEIEVYMTDENMWMSQQIMSTLFGVEEHTITYHIQEIFKSGELEENPTTRKIRVVRSEGKRPSEQKCKAVQMFDIFFSFFRFNSKYFCIFG
ncbi:MAG: hypothetical protein WCR42_06205 [bacterium]